MMDTKRTIEMNVIHGAAIANGLTIACVTHALQHGAYVPMLECVVVSITLMGAQWHGVVNDITTAIVADTGNVARLRHARCMVRDALTMGQRNIE